MSETRIGRKQFLKSTGWCCAASLLGTVAAAARPARARQEDPPPAAPPGKPRSEKRIEFTERWVPRFFAALDANLDAGTRKKIMMANGRACFQDWVKKTGRKVAPITLDQLSAHVRDHVTDGSIRVEGNTIHFQFMAAAETGKPSQEGQCLCPLVETKPAGLSGTYCLCSVGYVKEWHEELLGRACDVDLVESVLTGGKRCRFRIAVA